MEIDKNFDCKFIKLAEKVNSNVPLKIVKNKFFKKTKNKQNTYYRNGI